MSTESEVITVVIDESNGSFSRSGPPDMGIVLKSTTGQTVKLSVPMTTPPGILEMLILTLQGFKQELEDDGND